MAYLSKGEAAYAELRRRITTGELPPGTKMNQEQLAADLGLSTTPLREAIRRLAAEGLVRTFTHREVMVSELAHDDLTALYDVRAHLEAFGASLAASSWDESDRRRIEEALVEVEAAAPGSEQLIGANQAFHLSIYEGSHNPVLIEMLTSLWARGAAYSRALARLQSHKLILDEHREIARLVLERKSAEVADRVRRHILEGASDFLRSTARNRSGAANDERR